MADEKINHFRKGFIPMHREDLLRPMWEDDGDQTPGLAQGARGEGGEINNFIMLMQGDLGLCAIPQNNR